MTDEWMTWSLDVTEVNGASLPWAATVSIINGSFMTVSDWFKIVGIHDYTYDDCWPSSSFFILVLTDTALCGSVVTVKRLTNFYYGHSISVSHTCKALGASHCFHYLLIMPLLWFCMLRKIRVESFLFLLWGFANRFSCEYPLWAIRVNLCRCCE